MGKVSEAGRPSAKGFTIFRAFGCSPRSPERFVQASECQG